MEDIEIKDSDFRYTPNRKLGEAEKQIIMLRIEKVRMKRERNLIILNKSTNLFFALLAVAVIGLVKEYITMTQLIFLMVLGFLSLIIGVIPYSFSTRKEEKDLEKTIDELTN